MHYGCPNIIFLLRWFNSITHSYVSQELCNYFQVVGVHYDYPLLFISLSQQSALSPDVNSWDKVDDFNWLSSKEHSPNWSLMISPDDQPPSVT